MEKGSRKEVYLAMRIYAQQGCIGRRGRTGIGSPVVKYGYATVGGLRGLEKTNFRIFYIIPKQQQIQLTLPRQKHP